MSVKINPHTLYSREDLAAMLKPLGVDVDTFIKKLGPAKPFKLAYWGRHLIVALDALEGGNSEPPPAAAWPAGPKGSRAKPRAVVISRNHERKN